MNLPSDTDFTYCPRGLVSGGPLGAAIGGASVLVLVC